MLLTGVAALLADMLTASGQDLFFRRTQLSDAVQFDLAPTSARIHLDRIDALIADEQWDEVVETLRRVSAEHGDKLIALPTSSDGRDSLAQLGGSERYVPLADVCQLRLAMLARQGPAALRLYRSQVDPLARRWLEKATAERDEALLRRIVDEMFTSSVGDESLYALGDIALERGEPALARAYLERISPELRAGTFPIASDEEGKPIYASGRPLWIEHRQQPKLDLESLTRDAQPSAAFLAYPDTDLNLADVRARLALASIMEGSHERAEFELEILKKLQPSAKGKLAGKSVDYHAALSALLKASRDWPSPDLRRDWPTFAGNDRRNARAPAEIDIAGTPVWSFALGDRFTMDPSLQLASGIGTRVAEDADGLLCVHPIVAGDVILLTDVIAAPQERDFPHWITRVRAYDMKTGQPAWLKGRTDDADDAGVVQQSRPFVVGYTDRRRWGVPRLTMSSHGRYAFARIGSPATMRPRDDLPVEGHDQIIALDLQQQGKLLWKPLEPDEHFAFEGSPVSDGTSLFVAMRHTQAQPQAFVAAYDLKTGQPRWRTWICAAESPALGHSEEVTHNLLTLHDGVIYFNTNLGAVAAVNADNGKILWATRYRRADFDSGVSGEAATNFQRDLNPCVYWRGLLFAASSDCKDLLCIEAASGQLLWSTPAGDIVHLLGVSDDGKLLASGRRLWWIDAETGITTARYPESKQAEPEGFGRGVLAGDVVYWPTKDAIYVFDQSTARMIRQPIDLSRRGLTGGNLLVADGHLLVTTADKVVAFTEQNGEIEE